MGSHQFNKRDGSKHHKRGFNEDNAGDRYARASFKTYLQTLEDELQAEDGEQWLVEQLIDNAWEVIEVFDDQVSAENYVAALDDSTDFRVTPA